MARALKKKKDGFDDWWEFREATGVLIRHHVTPRTTLFRPTSVNGCPVPPFKLDYTRVTEVKYVGGGVDTETSDWHGPQSGSRAPERAWTGRSTFHISAAEILEDESELKRDEDNWEKLIGDLTKPVEMDTIYMVYPVRARRGGDVMLAVQEAVLRLKLLGLPVARLHSDRGSEFASKGLRKWLLDHDIYHTRSEALVPQTNGAAERGVRWFKTMAKVLIAEGKVALKYWTLAMQHAANRRIQERLGLNKPRLLPFGSKVMIRRKVFGNNKKYDLTDRWEEGIYLGLSDTIKGGAVVLRPSGVITETLNLKANVVDPHVLLADPGDDGGGVGDIPLGTVGGNELRGLWLSDAHQVSKEDGTEGCDLRRELPDGATAEGRVVDIRDKVAVFDPKKVHSYVEGEDGQRWIIAGFTPLGAQELKVDDDGWSESSSQSDSSENISSDEEETLERKARVLRCELQEECAYESDDEATPYLRKLQGAFEGCAQELEQIQVVHNVSLPEVKKYVHLWREAIAREVNALMESGTVKRLSPEQTRELKKAGLVVLPGKAVFTVKPPSDPSGSAKFRRKCRVVVCSNFLPAQGQNLYASGTSADTLRISVALAVKMGWSMESTDVANAFTLAPMPSELSYAVTPPTIAPRLWGEFRNARFLDAEVMYGDQVLALSATTTDENLWQIKLQGEEELQGLVLVYVDDILILAKREVVEAIYQWLVSDWKCSNLEWVEDGSLRLFGKELRVCGAGVHLSQAGYIRDLLRQHGMSEEVDAALTVPCAREWLQDVDSDEEPEAAEEANVRLAQKATEEALWLSTRSRPELAHAVGCMASLAMRRPLRALEIGKRIMKYLAKTAEFGIWYKVVAEDPRSVLWINDGADMWNASGMAGVKAADYHSVGEAELYEGCSAVQLGLGVSALLSELLLDPVMHLRIDNAAAQGLASEAQGTWKTRHLRIRARFLRQEVAAQRLVISHVCGNLQKADLGTKGFDLPKFKALMDLWQIVPACPKEAAKAALRTLRTTNQRGLLMFIIVCRCLIKGVEGGKEDLALDGSMEFYFVLAVSLIAAVGLWEMMKYVKNKSWLWWNARQRRIQRSERLRNRTRDAAVTDQDPTIDNVKATEFLDSSHSSDVWQVSASVAVQTDPMPAMIPANRLEAYRGPFYITTHGDRVHMTSYCHGQRNATRASKRFDRDLVPITTS
eukprot:s1232_g22.t1